ncbi:MAG: PAS domain S-box protein [bacterium]|jgi:PAS domain S-box-containing protein|nr:PAS domain S-box protein [bacterium]
MVSVADSSGVDQARPNPVRVGILANRGKEQCLQRWGETIRYLDQAVSGSSFELIPVTFDEMVSKVENAEVELILLNSYYFVSVQKFYGAQGIATIRSSPVQEWASQFGGVLFCRQDHPSIHSLHDLEGKSFMAVDPSSFGGWMAAWRELKTLDIDPQHDFSSLQFGGTHDAVVTAVLEGRVDAGTVRTGILEKMAAEGQIRLDEFRILNPYPVSEGSPPYPFVLSTRLYPEWPLAKLRHTPMAVAEKVAAALLLMPSDHPALHPEGYEGWTLPLDYQPVHDCLAELGLGPYQPMEKFYLIDVLLRYWVWILAGLAFMMALLIFALYHSRLNHRLKTMARNLILNKERLAATLYSIGDGVICTDEQGLISDMNLAAEQLTGWTLEEARNKPLEEILEIVHAVTREPIPHPIHQVLATGQTASMTSDVLLVSRTGLEYFIKKSAAPIHNQDGTVIGVVQVIHDVTDEARTRQLEQTRLALIEFATTHTIDEIMTKSLDEVGNLVNSPIGFYHFVHKDQKTLTLQQWSTRTLQEFCQMEAKGVHYPIDEAGVWVDCVRENRPLIHNDYPSLPHKKGLPSGHAPIFRELVVPVKRKDKIVAILGVGNKPVDYTESDLQLVSYLADITWEVITRKRADESFKTAHERLRVIMHSVPAGILLIRARDRVIVDINPTAARIYGVSPTQLIGTVCNEPQCRDGNGACPVLDLGLNIENTECRLSRVDGSIVPILKSVKRVVLEGEQYLLETFGEITELKKAQSELERSREQFMLAVNGTNDGIWDWNLKEDSLFLSARWKEQLGYNDSELENTFATFESLIYPEDHSRVMEYIQRYFKGSEDIYDVQYRMRHKNGGFRWILSRGRCVRDEQGTIYRLAGSHTDITTQKTNEETLRAQREHLEQERRNLQLIFDAVQVGMLLLDANGDITRVNQVAARLVGKDVVDMLSRQPGDGLCCVHALSILQGCGHAEACPQCPIRNSFNYVRETGNPVRGLETAQRLIIAGEEKLFYFSLSATPLVLDEKKHILLAITDITERKLSELEIARSKSELEQVNLALQESIRRANQMAVQAEAANIAKSQFLANMSHEIRTPMNGVIGMAGLLSDTSLNEEQRHFVNIIQTSANSLLDLINDILDFSKIEAGHLDLDPIDFNLRIVMEECSDLLAVRAQDKGLEFIWTIEPHVPLFLVGDPGRLRQIIINLTGNAIKFTASGEIVIRVHCAEETDEQVTLRFSVRDTGIGIPNDKLPLLFNAFEQLDASTTRKFGGTGLGLVISKRLAELMGGSIGVESQVGLGSTFWFTVVFQKQKEPSVETVINTDSLKGARILVVDDNATNREVMRLVLGSWKVQYGEAASAQEALQRLRDAHKQGLPFQLAILDMQMPGMDGEQLAAGIQADVSIADTPLVMMSSIGVRMDGNRTQQALLAAYLTKPVKRGELFSCLQSILDGGKPAHSQATASKPLLKGYALSPAQLAHVRILLVEDNVTNQKVALNILHKLGYKVDVAANGLEAIALLEMGHYTLVLMDVQMPVMDGLEATRYIRSGNTKIENPQLPIIAMTANAMKGDRELCLDCGMDDYIAKPVEPESLATVLYRWLADVPGESSESQETKSTPTPETAVADSFPSLPIFDENTFAHRLMDDENLVQIVLQGFVEDIPKQIALLQTHLDSRDLTSASRLAHTIKGAAANVSAEAFRHIAYEMEKAGKAQDLQAMRDSFPELQHQFNQLLCVIQKKLGEDHADDTLER